MLILDSQVHAYERDSPQRPWDELMPGAEQATGDDMVRAMDAVGVDGAILVSPYKNYKFDPGYILDVYAQYPTRFGLVTPVNPHAPDIVDIVSDWASKPGTVGIRILFVDGVSLDPANEDTNRLLQLASEINLPVSILCWGNLDLAPGLAERNPDTQLIIDHLGLLQPFNPPAPPTPWADLPKLIRLAQYPNITVKVSGACTLSHKSFPYPDIWDPLARVFDAFGFDRLMWGSDWTRCANVLSYREGVDSFRLTDRLSDSDRERLMGGTLQTIYNWSPL